MLLDEAEVLAVCLEDLEQPAEVEAITVPTTGNPSRAKPYKQTAEETEFLRSTCASMEAAGIIRRSRSPWALSCFVAYRKLNGIKIKSGKMRKVVDCRPLNNVSPRDAYPIPPLEQTIDRL